MVPNPQHKAKKSFGQHFLHDEEVLLTMCNEMNGDLNTPIIEIGPGTGTLTKVLLETGRPIFAIEKDPTLIPHLKEQFASYSNFHIFHQDILTFTPDPTWDNYEICANIPYYITQPIIQYFLWEQKTPPTKLTVLVQKEVAEKYTQAKPPYSAFYITSSFVSKPEYIAFVPRTLFTPPPKVDSAILSFSDVLRERPSFFPQLKKLITTCFQNSRKKLNNTLPSPIKHKLLVSSFADILEKRPEEIDPQTWLQMGKLIFE